MQQLCESNDLQSFNCWSRVSGKLSLIRNSADYTLLFQGTRGSELKKLKLVIQIINYFQHSLWYPNSVEMSDRCHAQNYAAMVLSSTVTLLFKAGFKPLCFAVTSYIAVTLVKMVLRLLMVFSLRSPVRKTETIQLCFLYIRDTFTEKWFSGKCPCSELHHTEVYGVKSLTGMNRTGQWKFLKLAFSRNLPNLLT